MLLASNSHINNLYIYRSFLNDIIEKDNQKFKLIFNEIISEAHDISIGKIDYSKVTPGIFDIVSFLFFSDANYLKSIDPSSIKESDYKKVLELLESELTK